MASSTPTTSDAVPRSQMACETEARPTEKVTFYHRSGKRAVDALISFVALILLSPLLLLIAVLVKLTSRGPALYWQERVGRDGHVFRIAKFRSMTANAEQNGRTITAAGDERVTPVGAILRKLKLDELPQLWNVMCGEMSLVGPRPELPLYVELYTPAQRQVLSVSPGITDPASIAYRHEEQILRSSEDPEALYREVVLPHKLLLNLGYIKSMSFFSDVAIIFRTLTSIL